MVEEEEEVVVMMTTEGASIATSEMAGTNGGGPEFQEEAGPRAGFGTCQLQVQLWLLETKSMRKWWWAKLMFVEPMDQRHARWGGSMESVNNGEIKSSVQQSMASKASWHQKHHGIKSIMASKAS